MATSGVLMIGVRVRAADRAEVADRERGALQVGEREVAVADVVGELGQRAGDVGDAQLVGVAEAGHDEAALGIDRDADVDVFLVDDLVVLQVDRGVDRRVVLEGARRPP